MKIIKYGGHTIRREYDMHLKCKVWAIYDSSNKLYTISLTIKKAKEFIDEYGDI